MSYEDDLRRRLEPCAVSANLLRVSALVTSYEILKAYLVNSLREFFTDEVDLGEDGLRSPESDEYRTEVLRGSKNRVRASLEWYVRNGVLSPAAADLFERLWAERNELVHQVQRFLLEPDRQFDDELVDGAVELSRSLGRYWGRVHVDCDPTFDGIDVDDETIESGVSIFLGYLSSVTNGMSTAFDQLADEDGSERGERPGEPGGSAADR